MTIWYLLTEDKVEVELIPIKPCSKKLRICFVHESIPFVGFGFLDNAVMIVAGDYIDLTIGATFGISVMAAAALGNTISDCCGIVFGGYVEMVADRMGLAKPRFTEAEADHSHARIAKVLYLTIRLEPL